MVDLRKAAAGKDCEVRVPLSCNFNRETTVLAHFRMIGLSGMGTKSPDWAAARACSGCHDAIDGRSKTDFTREQLQLMHLEGVIRTWQAYEREGLKPW